MSTIVDSIDSTIAARIRGERAARRWSLDDLAERSGVSKAMISKIERAEASATAALLGRLSAALGLTLSAMLAESETPHRGPLRAADQPVWRDPATGYIRRQVAASPTIPIELTEVDLPPGASVSFPAASYRGMSHVVWVLAGRLTFVEGDVTHELGPGDSLEFGPPADCTYRNDSTAPCRYLVVLLRR
jgi:transcriptional regulator with XRE-family HTH domain